MVYKIENKKIYEFTVYGSQFQTFYSRSVQLDQFIIFPIGKDWSPPAYTNMLCGLVITMKDTKL